MNTHTSYSGIMPKNENNMKVIIDFEKKMKSNFDVVFSTYTAKIILHTKNKQVKTKMLTERRSPRVFMASRMIEKDLNGYTANEVDSIDENCVSYYSHNLRECSHRRVINIDIKNAYATILFNNGFISEKTFSFLKSLQKIDRLASVGMIAYKKNIFHYINGELSSTDVETGKFRNVFFYCVRKTQEIMDACKKALNNRYHFTWVDGIYIDNIDKNIITVSDILKENNMSFSIEALSNFGVKNINNTFYVTFDGKNGKKTFNIPENTHQMRNSFFDYLNRDYKNN